MKKNNDEWFSISNLNDFINASRIFVFDNFGKDEMQMQSASGILNLLTPEQTQELDSVLSFNECISISKSFIQTDTNDTTNDIRHLISSSKYIKMLESFSSRMVSNILNSLVNKGQLETAFDETCNDFVFWTKEDNA